MSLGPLLRNATEISFTISKNLASALSVEAAEPACHSHAAFTFARYILNCAFLRREIQPNR